MPPTSRRSGERGKLGKWRHADFTCKSCGYRIARYTRENDLKDICAECELKGTWGGPVSGRRKA